MSNKKHIRMFFFIELNKDQKDIDSSSEQKIKKNKAQQGTTK